MINSEIHIYKLFKQRHGWFQHQIQGHHVVTSALKIQDLTQRQASRTFQEKKPLKWRSDHPNTDELYQPMVQIGKGNDQS